MGHRVCEVLSKAALTGAPGPPRGKGHQPSGAKRVCEEPAASVSSIIPPSQRGALGTSDNRWCL